jgi:hypothetical protein
VLPERLIDGLGVAGGIMPAIGFAVLLKIMMKNVYIPISSSVLLPQPGSSFRCWLSPPPRWQWR